MTKRLLPISRLSSALALGALSIGTIFALPPSAHAAVTCFNFESLTAGTQFNIGDTFTVAHGEVRFVPLLPNQPSSGFGRIVTSNFAGGSAFQELNLNNIGMRLVLDDPCEHAKFRYDDHGGFVNFELNGTVVVLDDLSQITMPGVTVTETLIAGGKRGTVSIDGPIESFGVGGQEFHIDDVCVDC